MLKTDIQSVFTTSTWKIRKERGVCFWFHSHLANQRVCFSCIFLRKWNINVFLQLLDKDKQKMTTKNMLYFTSVLCPLPNSQIENVHIFVSYPLAKYFIFAERKNNKATCLRTTRLIQIERFNGHWPFLQFSDRLTRVKGKGNEPLST